jgi:hypothetical protein
MVPFHLSTTWQMIKTFPLMVPYHKVYKATTNEFFLMLHSFFYNTKIELCQQPPH